MPITSVTLPQRGAGLPPRVVTFMSLDVRRSREFWRCFNG